MTDIFWTHQDHNTELGTLLAMAHQRGGAHGRTDWVEIPPSPRLWLHSGLVKACLGHSLNAKDLVDDSLAELPRFETSGLYEIEDEETGLRFVVEFSGDSVLAWPADLWPDLLGDDHT